MLGNWLLISCVLMSRLAAADDVHPPPPPPVPAEQVSGVEIPDNVEDHSVARVLLTPLRWTTMLVAAPFRGGAYVLDRYQLRDRIEQLLFSEDGTFGVYPTAFIESQLGLNVGLHVVDSDLFGHAEHFSAAASYGGEFQQAYEGTLTSGELLGAAALKARVSYQAWNRSSFFGIGNADLSPVMPAMIDALADDTAIHTRFGQHVTHGELLGSVAIMGPFTLGLAGSYTRRTFNDHAIVDEFERTVAAYDPASLVGYVDGADNLYGELSLTIDNRHYRTRYISRAAPSSGFWGSVFVGGAKGISGDPSRYLRYGGDLHRYLDLYHGDRVLILRARFEAVTANLDQIPFTDLPRLGGNEVLRGFEVDRFRDRVAALVSAEYDFPIHYGVYGYLFVDGGRVAHDIGDLDPSGIHVGYGGGFQIHTLNAFLFRAQIAHSGDGTFLRLALDPLRDTRIKQRRL